MVTKMQAYDDGSGYKQAIDKWGTLVANRSDVLLRKQGRWVAVDSDADTDTGAYCTWVLKTPNTSTTYVVTIKPQTTGNALVRLRTGTVATTHPGTRVNFCNRDFSVSTTPSLKLYVDPLIATSGTVRAKYYIGDNYLGDSGKWILNANSTYAIEVQSVGDNNVTNLIVEAETK
jgi:hypothetical protein